MDDIWSDGDISPTSTFSFSTVSTHASSPTLTPYQKELVRLYKVHNSHIDDLMNTVVEIEISIRRERDDPSVPCLKAEYEKAQLDLVMHRDGKRKNDRKIKYEQKRLEMVVGEGSVAAREQLGEMRRYMEKEKAIVCLR
jgi:hypothetical protein